MKQDDMDTPSERMDYSRPLEEEMFWAIAAQGLDRIDEQAMRTRLREYIVEERIARIFGEKS